MRNEKIYSYIGGMPFVNFCNYHVEDYTVASRYM